MDSSYSILNNYLVDFFNGILRIEENSLKISHEDLSISEMHTIEAIIKAKDKSLGNVASLLNVTNGTLSVAVKTLVTKGYVTKVKGNPDKRVVYLALTEKGLNADKSHNQFHHSMVNSIIEELSAKELEVLMKGIEKLNKHFTSVDKMV